MLGAPQVETCGYGKFWRRVLEAAAVASPSALPADRDGLRAFPGAVGYRGVCTAWNKSLMRTPRPSEMRYSVSMEAEFLPSSICER